MPRKIKTIEHKEENARPKRVPLHEQPRNVLTVTGLPNNMKARWVLDVKQRINRMQLAGWEHVRYGDLEIGDRTVHTPQGKKENDIVVLDTNAGNDKLYLIMINKDWYDEDQASKQAEIDDHERNMIVDDPREKGLTGEISLRK